MNRTIRCDAVIFDLDGTLVDSNPSIEKVWEWWACKYNVDFQKVLSVCHGRPCLFTMKMLLPDMASENMAAEFLEKEIEEAKSLKPVKGAREFLMSLPHESWGIATSGKKQLAEARLRGAGLPIPTIMITADEIVKGKPDPEPFLKTADKLGVKPENSVVFEDSELGIQSALSSGAKLIGVNVSEHLKSKYNFSCLIPDFSRVKACVENGRIIIECLTAK